MNINQVSTIKELEKILDTAKPTISFFHGRRFSVTCYGNNIRFNDLLKITNNILKNQIDADLNVLKKLNDLKDVSSLDQKFKSQHSRTYLFCLNAITSIRRFVGNLNRDHSILTLMDSIITKKNIEYKLKEFPFDWQVKYCTKNPHALKHAKPQVQRFIVRKNPKKLPETSQDIQNEPQKNSKENNWGFFNVSAEDLELKNGDKKITIEQSKKETTINTLADEILLNIKNLKSQLPIDISEHKEKRKKSSTFYDLIKFNSSLINVFENWPKESETGPYIFLSSEISNDDKNKALYIARYYNAKGERTFGEDPDNPNILSQILNALVNKGYIKTYTRAKRVNTIVLFGFD